MKLHYLRSDHVEGTRHVNLNDGRSVQFEVGAVVAVPCEGVTCPICTEKVKLAADVKTAVGTDRGAEPVGFTKATVVVKRDATVEKQIVAKVAVAEVEP
jgi:hypothetical protein